MKLIEFLVSILAFVFTVFLFPTLNDVCSTYSGELAQVVHAFPIVFLAVVLIFPVYFAFKRDEE